MEMGVKGRKDKESRVGKRGKQEKDNDTPERIYEMRIKN